MALGMIASIKKAEEKAQKIIKDAQAQAKQILKDATDRSYQIATCAEEATEQEVSSIIAGGETSAREQCSEILAVAGREASALRELCAPRMEKAVRLIVNRLRK